MPAICDIYMAYKSYVSLILSILSSSSLFLLLYNRLYLVPKYRLDIAITIYHQLLMLNLQPNNRWLYYWMMRCTRSDNHLASRNGYAIAFAASSAALSATSCCLPPLERMPWPWPSSRSRSTAWSMVLRDVISAQMYALRNMDLLIMPCILYQNGNTNHLYHTNNSPTSGGMNRWMILIWSDCWKFLWYAMMKHICPWLTNMLYLYRVAVAYTALVLLYLIPL